MSSPGSSVGSRSPLPLDLSRPDALSHPEVQKLLRTLLLPAAVEAQASAVPAPSAAPTPSALPAPTTTALSSDVAGLFSQPALLPGPTPTPMSTTVPTPTPLPTPMPTPLAGFHIPKKTPVSTLSREEDLQRQLVEERSRCQEAERSRRSRHSGSRSPRHRR
ncbi:putative uncharacterized protein DDB_G0290521 [Haliotis rubra]|uniref:putative uncharacterized protein DDB_G0290521 n=1 Tax=Haliotis rubra TaxID=36100 RepID=UPI001EE59A07|nr:putative uncharacterized protein DDB_G0290521 [Haliotis rubra]